MDRRGRTTVAIVILLAVGCTSHTTDWSAPSSSSKPGLRTGVPWFKLGIRRGLEAPAGFSATNAWLGLDGAGNLLQIWAGAPRARSDDGGLVIHTWKPMSDNSWQVFERSASVGPSPDGALKIISASGHWLELRAADGAQVRFNWNTNAFSKVPTCAPRRAPWASAACPESIWVRQVVAAAGGQITGLTDGVEPQRNSAFLVELDGHRFSFGAVSRESMGRMGSYFSMGEFGAGMGPSGSVNAVPLFGNRKTEHWSWKASGFTVEIYESHAPRSTIADLVKASIAVP
jgi:hypothetical protein